ncbi:unnamed protein product [Polarella glacialis]|uniref:Protein kinase domain-containing protein n=1 Tax=Polarella glacialis TaxID=89957 RepID=A0A813ICE6_POLGL|nr:unnamed protein product [Polarella glacialis]
MGCFCSNEAAAKQLQWSFVSDTTFDSDLCQVLTARGALPEEEGLVVICGVISAISHLHLHQVVHRDVQANHVFFGPSGKACLCGLGSAAFCRDPGALQRRRATPGYAAPELVSGEFYGLEVDVFATGVLLYLIVSNMMPFGGGDICRVKSLTKRCEVKFPEPAFSQVTGAMMVIIEALMKKSPQSRPTAKRSFQACWKMLSSAARIRALSLGQICPRQVELHADPLDEPSPLLQMSSAGRRRSSRSFCKLPSITEIRQKAGKNAVEQEDEQEPHTKQPKPPEQPMTPGGAPRMILSTAGPTLRPEPPTAPRSRSSFLRYFGRFGFVDRSMQVK